MKLSLNLYVMWFTKTGYTFVTFQLGCVLELRISEMGFYIKWEC